MSQVDDMLAGRAMAAASDGGIGYNNTHQAAQSSRLMGWTSYITEPNSDWVFDSARLSARAWDLVTNDPFARAMLEAVIQGTLGPDGMAFHSLYQEDDAPQTSDAERAKRREIDAGVARARSGKRMDAGGQLSARELEACIVASMVTSGDGFAVRVWAPGRPGAYQGQSWRVIAPERVSNDKGAPNSPTLFEGIEFHEDGHPVALWVRDRHPRDWQAGSKATWTRIPWFAEDGTQNVIHRFRAIRPGQRRGFSWFAPLLIMAKHLAGTNEAYVVAKRAAACHPIFFKTSDPKQAAEWARQGATFGPNTPIAPGQANYIGLNADVVIPQWQFNGADHEAFVDSLARVATACWGLPFQFVLQQLTKTNLAASRAALDQAFKTFTWMQDAHIIDVTRPMVEAIIREEVARGRLDLDLSEPDRSLAGRFSRPAKPSTDKARDAQWAESLINLGWSRTTVFAALGDDFEAETAQRAQDDAYMAAQGVTVGALQRPAKFAVGDRVQPTIPAHMPGAEGPGTIEIIDASQPLGIRFDAMPDMIHKWYTSREVKALPAGSKPADSDPADDEQADPEEPSDPMDHQK